MGTQGTFGYIIGKKKRMMHVDCDADLLWKLLVREIFVLMKNYGSKEALQIAFEGIKTTKNNPKDSDIEKLKVFTDLNVSSEKYNDWNCLLRHCQSSYINILEAGYILHKKDENGLIFMLDFNKFSVSFYGKNYDGSTKIFDTATIEEIMEFDDMPTKTYTEIVNEMTDQFQIWNDKYIKVNEELLHLKQFKQKTKTQGATNIEDKIDKMIYDVDLLKVQLQTNRRVFYHRLKALDLIVDDKNN